MTRRFVCIHGHFYQPPRETPGLGIVEPQPSAAPYRDWNERITAECYRPNSRARLLDGEGRLRRLVNNYERLSFDFGPTLLCWLERHAPDVHAAILAGDRESQRGKSRRGGAIAHPYHHSILPLSSPRDRRTEIAWGIADFEKRFNRRPEGMWLPETAVDLETLDELAAQGIRFTLLAPRQAKRTRDAETLAWKDVSDGSIDVRRPYRVSLPSGRSIEVIFYHGAMSQGVAFERLLDSADGWVERIVKSFDAESKDAQIVTIATDGETYGHHHHFGDMALARAIELLGKRDDLELVTPGEFLARFPARDEVELVSPSAWSCAHGVERWRSNCGCRIGGAERSQAWRAPLRGAIESLRMALAENFETAAGVILDDPWAARDAVVVSDRAADVIEARARRPVSSSERVMLLELLDAQREALAMFTSCGWFFDDVAGIETLQVLAHADRAIELTHRALGVDLSLEFARRLEAAVANDPADGNAARLLRERVIPRRGDAARIARHAAMLALRDPLGKFEAAGHRVERLECASLGVGDAALSLGTLRVDDPRTGRSLEYRHAVIETGRLRFAGGIAEGKDETALREIEAAFAQSTEDGIAAIGRAFPPSSPPCGLEWLLPAERGKFVEQAFVGDLRDLASIERRIADGCAKISERLDALGIAFPAALSRVLAARDAGALELAASADRRELAAALERAAVREPIEATKAVGVTARVTARIADEIEAAAPLDDGGERIREIVALVRAAMKWRPAIDLQSLQETALVELGRDAARLSALAARDSIARARWNAFRELADLLRIVIDEARNPATSA